MTHTHTHVRQNNTSLRDDGSGLPEWRVMCVCVRSSLCVRLHRSTHGDVMGIQNKITLLSSFHPSTIVAMPFFSPRWLASFVPCRASHSVSNTSKLQKSPRSVCYYLGQLTLQSHCLLIVKNAPFFILALLLRRCCFKHPFVVLCILLLWKRFLCRDRKWMLWVFFLLTSLEQP